MLANPSIANYKPFFIQYGTNSTASDTLQTWGLIAKVNPFPALPTPKDPYKNEWHDENGDDEYNAQMAYQSFEFEVKFYIKAKNTMSGNSITESAVETIRAKMAGFFNAVKQGEFKIYDSYTGLGRQKVRYAGYTEDEFHSFSEGSDRHEDFAYAVFGVKFKVNDPVTFCRMSNGSIVNI